MHAHDTLSNLVTGSHTPKVSAFGSHDVHSLHVSVLFSITPAKPPPHWHRSEPAGEVLKLGHGQHCCTLSDAEKVPLAQAVQLDSRIAPVLFWTFPAAQAVQLDSRTAPVAFWYLPAPHRVQLVRFAAPRPVWYVPARHRVQLDALAIPVPVRKVPAAHRLHADVLADSAYDPAAQRRHAPLELAPGLPW